MKKRIVLAMLAAGGGHSAPARAVHESLEHLYPDRYEVRYMDFMHDLGCRQLDRRHKSSWNFLLAHPRLGRAAYRWMQFCGPASRFNTRLVISSFYPYVYRFLKHYRPHVIYSTHYLNSYPVADVSRTCGFSVALITQVTEVEFSPASAY